jgi:hypothetical protein
MNRRNPRLKSRGLSSTINAIPDHEAPVQSAIFGFVLPGASLHVIAPTIVNPDFKNLSLIEQSKPFGFVFENLHVRSLRSFNFAVTRGLLRNPARAMIPGALRNGLNFRAAPMSFRLSENGSSSLKIPCAMMSDQLPRRPDWKIIAVTPCVPLNFRATNLCIGRNSADPTLLV